MFEGANRIALYTLVAVGLLGGALFLGLNILNAGENKVAGVDGPSVSSTPDPVSESVADKNKTKEADKDRQVAREKAEQEKKEAEKKAAKEKAEAKKKAEAERKAREQAAAEQAAAEQAAAERAAAEQAAAEQAAAEQAAAERAAAEQAAAERAARRDAAQATPAAAPAPASDMLSLSIPKLGRYNDPVTNSVAESVLHYGAGKLPQTGFPWQTGANTYIAAHVYGYPGTGSWQQFAGLPNMTYGDEIYLTDANGTQYTYQVSEILTVSPYDTWVTAPTGQNMVTLQTCTGPGWSQRLIVRGQLVSVA